MPTSAQTETKQTTFTAPAKPLRIWDEDAGFAEGGEFGDGAGAAVRHHDGRRGEQAGQLVGDEVDDVVAAGDLRGKPVTCAMNRFARKPSTEDPLRSLNHRVRNRCELKRPGTPAGARIFSFMYRAAVSAQAGERNEDVLAALQFAAYPVHHFRQGLTTTTVRPHEHAENFARCGQMAGLLRREFAGLIQATQRPLAITDPKLCSGKVHEVVACAYGWKSSRNRNLCCSVHRSWTIVKLYAGRDFMNADVCGPERELMPSAVVVLAT